MHFLIFTLLLFQSFFDNITADEFEYRKSESYMSFNKIHRDLKSSIIFRTYTGVKSLLSCSSKCLSTSLYYMHVEDICHCNNDIDTNSDHDPEKPGVIYGYYPISMEISRFKHFTKWNVRPIKIDCLDLYIAGLSADGVYTIKPPGQNMTDVWCDMSNGGWTVFQRRQDGSEDFNRGWSEYASGFGNRTGEFWLGLDNIHSLTTQPSELHIYMETFGDRTPVSAEIRYSEFIVDGPSHEFTLHVGGFNSTCGVDPFAVYGNNMSFTTYDNHNDISTSNCAVRYKGGWWYELCHRINLNGFYHGGEHASFADGVNYMFCWGYYYSLKTSIMKIRRK